jgi:hypothetical protein
MNSKSNPPEVGQLTLVSLIIFFVIYPMTLIASGPLSNGGIIGFIVWGSILNAQLFGFS